ncbi:uvrD/REP helicase family protein [Sphingomonas sp. S17]|uniref:DNA 3'-5' helicase n=2 Tax=Sphingomonas paucimobilis TaxID=13689 RepID=A0A411LFM8_SPHPI|nr:MULTISPECIES: UvrD-helicase domain-containing protein [Sphingomonas]EGI56690.1 uvrD/REP helicase family protein [Sphingomonas sp. S17]MBQ1479959.1 UvrD-helicase domain-containing protein [Sphingomonas sp.]MCM3679140.1 UvrD-helicase domain-containing protein [Sphingomonas paucimobilis]MDG5971893.1 UvrD-helicase domain-containing protein [Sphingomonas paucimobilis]NNG58098.1 UvrD-helicase domain-containing protein [Sphingomonas paucimobilis]
MTAVTPDIPANLADYPYLRTLNPAQREAVLTTDGPVLVLAGAGTGKTAALTARLAHLLYTRKAWPSEILSVTFTNKAAREMRERVGRLVGDAVEGMPWLGTFHAIGAKMLRRHAELVGLQSNFTILDTDDQLRLLKQLIVAADIDEKRFPARALGGLIDEWKNKGLVPADIDAGEAERYANGRGAELYRQYQERLRSVNACDFGDLLLHMLTILKTHRDVLEHYQQRFRYIMVDEYQDTNSVQYLWLRLLAQARKNIACVGDDDQSIYSWRGAQVENILRFERDFPGAKVIRLEQNYRSTPHILGAASGVIANNGGRLGKTLWTELDVGEKVRVLGVWDGPEEARRVGEEIEAARRSGTSYGDIAILVRAQHQTREFEDRFIAIGLPYRIVGGFRFYERAEIRDALAYLRVVNQPSDDLAFERIVNVPKRGLGDKALAKIHQLARADGLPLTLAAARILDTDELTPQARRSLGNLIGDIARWRDMARDLPHAELARQMLDESGYTAMYQAEKSAEAAGRLENLTELVRAMEDYESLGAFLEHVSLVMDRDGDQREPEVTIMTIHAAKGLEFDTVFLAGWEEGLFPSQRAIDEGGTRSLEEERRLAYVAITRARRKAIILHAANRRIYGQWTSSLPSRFVGELPPEHIDSETSMTGGESLWRANWSEHADPFANVARGTGRGPGWQRAAAGQNGLPVRPARIVESRAPSVGLGQKGRDDLGVGDRVFHQKFGYGTIAAIEGNKLEIDFEQAGRKRVMDSFVTKSVG